MPDRSRRPRPLLLLLLIFTLLTVYNSIRLPLGEAADETDHYQYLRFVARTGHPPLTQAEREEAGFKGGLAPLYYWLTAWPIALVGEDALPDIRRVDSRPERHLPTDGLGINHLLHTLDEQWPWRGQALAWHLVRLLSLPMAWVTIFAVYALARRLLPEQPGIALGAAVFVAFLPRFVISSAVVNDDNLVFALTALLLLTQVILIQGDRRARVLALFGALFGLSLLTKYFSLILIPEVIFTLVVYRVAGSQGRRVARRRVTGSGVAGGWQKKTRDSLLSPLSAFILALGLTAGPWFTFIVLRFNRVGELGLIPGLAAALGEPQITEGLVGLLSGQSVRPAAATYPLPEWFALLYRSFWFEYGWMRIFAPWWIYGLFTIFLLVALLGLVRYLATPQSTQNQKSGVRLTRLASPLTWLLALHLALYLFVVFARYILSATIDTGQGRHLYPALPVIALLFSCGLFNLRRLRLLSPRSLPTPYSPRSLPTPYFLLLFLPAVISLYPPAFILPHYHTRPVTITPPAELPITHRQTIEFADGLWLAGFDTPEQALAGETLPVRLYWRAEQEAKQDYLLSLCLRDEQERPAACWRGHFADGRYPARAWEEGETLVDTVYIPIPICHRLTGQNYRLRLELWPLAPDSPTSTPVNEAVLSQTFAEPRIRLRPPVGPVNERARMVELWRAKTRLSGPTEIALRESVAQIAYSSRHDRPASVLSSGEGDWPPLPELDTALTKTCADGPAPLAHLSHFIADPDLPPAVYVSTQPKITLSLSGRRRNLAPIQSDLRFEPYLSPLTLQLPDEKTLDLSKFTDNSFEQTRPYSLFPNASLPLTLRWQARRWMADPLVVSLKLLDKDFQIGGERIATLGDRYPNVLWVPGEIVEETYPVRLQPEAPPGLYRLELSLVRQDESRPDGFEYLPLIDGETELGPNLYPLTVRLLDPAHNELPSRPVSAQLGETIQLFGYDLDNSIPKTQDLNLTLYWQSTAAISGDYTVFTQLIGPDGQLWAQWDNPPQAGRYPTSAWTVGDKIVDRYALTLRAGAPPGEYRLLVGMYDPASGQRLPATVEGQPQPEQAIELARIRLGQN